MRSRVRPVFDLTSLESSLAGSVYAGKLNYAPVTESTNSDALAAARSGAPHGSVFFVDEQTAGRGRGGHQWLSSAGDGLYVSVILRLNVSADRLMLLPLAVGLAAAQAIDEVTGLAVDIRWPNDLLIGPLKAGGILVEARTESKEPPHGHPTQLSPASASMCTSGPFQLTWPRPPLHSTLRWVAG
jgi:BirA family biotin operon repressor/biotin-[acetyl-CoA-carboxylase] ligase